MDFEPHDPSVHPQHGPCMACIGYTDLRAPELRVVRDAPEDPRLWDEGQIRVAIREAIWEDYPLVKGDIDDFNCDVIANWAIARLKRVENDRS